MRSRKQSLKIEVKESTIPNAGQGLFATVDIQPKSIIAEFKGRVRKPDEDVTKNRSLIRFADGYFLECPDTDLPSFVNDPIDFPTTRRKLYETLESEKSFYPMHPKASNNSYIKLMQPKHRAFLVAIIPIPCGSEIFCHYGFNQWFMKEFLNGFSFEEKMDLNGFPPRLYACPAFKSYINTFYPNCIDYQAQDYPDGTTQITIKQPNSESTVLQLDNYASMMRKTTFN
jgi:hypothetical protein